MIAASKAPQASGSTTRQDTVSKRGKVIGDGRKKRCKRNFDRAFGADLTNNAAKRRKTLSTDNTGAIKKSTQSNEKDDDHKDPEIIVSTKKETVKETVSVENTAKRRKSDANKNPTQRTQQNDDDCKDPEEATESTEGTVKETVSEAEQIEAQIIRAPVRRVWDLPDDSRALSDEMLCKEYATEMMADLWENEAAMDCWPLMNYMKFQTDLVKRMRKILVHWLIEMHYKFRLEQSTLFLGVSLLDRYLCTKQVGRDSLQLCGSTCVWIACKYFMILPPTLDDFVFIANDAFTVDRMIRMEMDIMAALSFQLTVPTTLQYGERFSIIMRHFLKRERECKIVRDLIFYVLEQCLISYTLSRKAPSLVGAAALLYSLLATKATSMEKLKADGIEAELGHSLETIKPVMVEIHQMMLAASSSKSKAIYKKWSTSAMSKISKLKFDKLDTNWMDEPL